MRESIIDKLRGLGRPWRAPKSAAARQHETLTHKTRAWQKPKKARRYLTVTEEDAIVASYVRCDLYLQTLARFAPAGRVCDLGCGPGLISIALHDAGYRVVAIDVSKAMLDLLRERAGPRDIERREGNGFAIPAREGEFDVVVSRMVLQHFPNWQDCLAEMARVTRPGGIIFFDFGSKEHWRVATSQLGEPEAPYPYSPDPADAKRHYALASAGEQQSAAARNGCVVEAIVPAGFFLNNAAFGAGLGPQGYALYLEKIRAFYAQPACREFIHWFEGQIVPHLPREFTYGNFTVMRKLPEDVERHHNS